MREIVQPASRLIGIRLANLLLKDFEEFPVIRGYGSSIIFTLF